jgi:Arc/MetJ-type ribon-helix-helix transcriptional regulator
MKKFNVGDHVVLVKDIGGGGKKGTICRISNDYGSGEPRYNVVRVDGAGKQFGNTLSASSGTFVSRIDAVREAIEGAEKELKQLRAELEFLEKYEDEEAYLAHQIADILKSGGREAAIAKILRSGRKTEFL